MQFEARLAEGGFLEHTEFLGNYYGTPTPSPPPGRDLLLEIELDGAQQVRALHPESLLVFVLPPTREEQRRRLEVAGDTDDKVAERLAKAEHEEPIGRALADHLVVNDDLDRAVDEIGRLIEAARKEPRRRRLTSFQGIFCSVRCNVERKEARWVSQGVRHGRPDVPADRV